MIDWPPGPKRGAKVMPGKSPTAWRCPVSMFIVITFGSASPKAM